MTEAEARGVLGGGGPDGMLAELVVISEEGVVHVPEHLSDAEAPRYVRRGHGMARAGVRGGIKAGDSVLVQGTGGVSIFALQFARLTGARVIATSSRDAKLAPGRRIRGVRRDQLQDDAALGRSRSRADWRRRINFVVEVGGAGTLTQSMRPSRAGTNQPDRRTDRRRRTGQSAANPDAQYSRTGHFRRLAGILRT